MVYRRGIELNVTFFVSIMNSRETCGYRPPLACLLHFYFSNHDLIQRLAGLIEFSINKCKTFQLPIPQP